MRRAKSNDTVNMAPTEREKLAGAKILAAVVQETQGWTVIQRVRAIGVALAVVMHGELP